MICESTVLREVIILKPHVHQDSRGFFLECYHQRKFADLGITDTFVQDNHSHSVRGTLRGLHYQLTQPQAKLCRVVQGEVWDVAVDLRVGSPTFGKWAGTILSDNNLKMIYIPRGFAHGFLVLSERADFLYKCSALYAPDDERGIRFDDPDLAIDWPIAGSLVSEKDRSYPRLAEVGRENLPDFKP